jgi:hypothetical protein
MRFAFICVYSWLTLFAGDGLTVQPTRVTLSTPQSKQQLISELTTGQFQQDLTAKTQWSSSNANIAAVSAAGVVTPVTDGEADITAKAASFTATVHVTVKGAKAPFTWSFRNNVVPVLTKSGCNSGSCHGALAGKNGFKLTLRGYDPEVDYYTLTRQASGSSLARRAKRGGCF